MVPENGLKDLAHETTVRVLQSDASAVLDVPHNHVAEESALADSAFAENRDVLPARGGRNTGYVAGVKGVVCFSDGKGVHNLSL